MAVTLTVNGRRHTVSAAPDTPLLYLLRNAQSHRSRHPARREGDVAMSAGNQITRRRFLGQTAALTVGFTLAPLARALAQGGPPPGPKLPGSLQTNRMLDGWLRINPDG